MKQLAGVLQKSVSLKKKKKCKGQSGREKKGSRFNSELTDKITKYNAQTSTGL